MPSKRTRKPAAPAEPAPDLSYIIESLRPLAVPIDSLNPDPANAKVHGDRDLAVLQSSIARFGQRSTITVNRKGNIIEKGNGTWQAMRAAGYTHIAAAFVDDDAVTATAYAIADNRTSELSHWDPDALNGLLNSLGDDFDLASIGFDDGDLDALIAAALPQEDTPPPAPSTPAATQEDAPPQPDQAAGLKKKWKTKPGQLWEISGPSGNIHRLLCGDCTKPEDVARLMGDAKAGLMNTDPPYGIKHDHQMNEKASHSVGSGGFRQYDKIKNDELTGEALQSFLESSIRAALPHLTENPAFYLWHPMLTQGTFFAAAAADILIHRQIIWVKPHFIFGRGDYHWQHELCFYGWIKGKRPAFNGERNQSSVWNFSIGREKEHPTEKPIQLFAAPMTNHLQPGEIAYEPFAGSGPQFVAAEQLGRLCYGLEIEPKYCAVILERMTNLGCECRLAPPAAA